MHSTILTIDATGEDSGGSTTVDFSAMTAKFAFDGGAGNDTVTMTAAQFATAPTIAGGGGSNTVVISDTGSITITDAEFANVSGIQTLKVSPVAFQSVDTITLGKDASTDSGPAP